VPAIAWDTESYEPARHGDAWRLSVEVRGADAAWADRFNELAEGQHERGQVRGGRWGLIRYHEVEGVITVADLHSGQEDAIRGHLGHLAEQAAGAGA
jgi:hypothetical protein